MSPQFVDFNHDGHLDIVAGTFAGCPYVAYGGKDGYAQPVEILDRDGARILINAFWNEKDRKWDSTERCDPEGEKLSEGHMTSAYAWDWDADGDLDLLLGDHREGGHVYLRVNEGSSTEAKFALRNQVVHVAGKPLAVPGTVTTPRMIDCDGDGLEDLVCGGMGDSYQQKAGGGVFVFRNTGKRGAPEFAAAQTLLEPSQKGQKEPTRPDAGLYMDLTDVDGDGDLDMAVGAYSMWTPEKPKLDDAQKQQLADLRAAMKKLDAEQTALLADVSKVVAGESAEAATARRQKIIASKQPELQALSKRRAELQSQIDPLDAAPKREVFVWFYENVGGKAGKRVVR